MDRKFNRQQRRKKIRAAKAYVAYTNLMSGLPFPLRVKTSWMILTGQKFGEPK